MKMEKFFEERDCDCPISTDYLARELYGLTYDELPTKEQTDHIMQLVEIICRARIGQPCGRRRGKQLWLITRMFHRGTVVSCKDKCYFKLFYDIYADGQPFRAPTHFLYYDNESLGQISIETIGEALEEIGVGTCTQLTPNRNGIVVHLAEPFTAPTSGSLLDIIWRYIRALRCVKESERCLAESPYSDFLDYL